MNGDRKTTNSENEMILLLTQAFTTKLKDKMKSNKENNEQERGKKNGYWHNGTENIGLMW